MEALRLGSEAHPRKKVIQDIYKIYNNNYNKESARQTKDNGSKRRRKVNYILLISCKTKFQN